ncbi:hypothetical protein RchiOBHm_Chr5g0019811 [Rosa chinensis]|uniref:Uncharacterized protein n=1 Tax=Rosa chinensis TaxID=74649 RepID=A0A2P6Q764_ROSCH|nr:hypothetical protein RchiOBHm_Chr5g0019811 [Rosa chinensis]
MGLASIILKFQTKRTNYWSQLYAGINVERVLSEEVVKEIIQMVMMRGVV